jgi:hypothetical protein
MEKVNVYLDWNCGGCDDYLDEIKNCCSALQYEYILTTCDDDPLLVFKEVRRLRDEGNTIEHLPIMVTKNNYNVENVYVGILDRTSIKNILKEL